jgi:hypothetical protein
MKQLAVALCVAWLACGAQAQTQTQSRPQAIYRCGPNGTEYSQAPCPGGKLVESSDPRSAAQREEAIRVAAQERKKAAELERERRAQQASTRPAQAAGFNGRPPPPEAAASGADRGKTRKRASKTKLDNTTDFVAVEPGAKRKRVRK